MRTELLLQLALLSTVLLVTSSEGFFFEYPKKVLMNFLHSLKEKKEAKKKPYIQHYHIHYYPVPHILYEPSVKAPKKHDLDDLHHQQLTSLGWSDYEYKYIPESKIKIPPKIIETWHEPSPWDHQILESDLSEIYDHSENEGILVEVPNNQKIIIEPGNLKKSKSSLLAALFHKFKSFKSDVHS